MNANTQISSPSKSPCGCGGASPTSSCGCKSSRSGMYLRPRFFAGQLLTEDDLQALGDYVLQKNRLHNRHLMGSGVVCGLDVTCNPCGGGTVIVHPGYALDCCGNDIVLPCKEELDINAMVRDLRLSQLGGYDCGDPCKEKPRATNGGKEDATNVKRNDSRHYCLYVLYYEAESDPVAPYASDEPCGQAICEPSRIREGYRFELRCSKEQAKAPNFVTRLGSCFGGLTASAAHITSYAEMVKTPGPAIIAIVKENLLDLIDRTPDLSDCALRAYVQAIVVPDSGSKESDHAVKEAVEKLTHAYMRFLRDCICAALNPPCAPCDEPGVLLACLEVKDCEVVDVCNMSRTFVLTAPSFRYWYGILADLIGKSLELACCSEIPMPNINVGNTEKKGSTQSAAETSATNTKPKQVATPLTGVIPAALLKGRIKGGMQKMSGFSTQDFSNLEQILGSLGALNQHGVFDRLVPGLGLSRKLNLQAELPEIVKEQIRNSEMVRDTVSRMVDEKVATKLGELKTGGGGLTAAEVDKRVNELISADKLAELDMHVKEIAALKRDLSALRTQLAEAKATPNPPKGRAK